MNSYLLMFNDILTEPPEVTLEQNKIELFSRAPDERLQAVT